MAEWRAAGRDASWRSQPNTHSAKVLHVIRPGAVSSVCDRRMLLDADADEPAHQVVPGLRCRRPACRTYFGYAVSLQAHRLEEASDG